jgi:hypothetical protein
MLMGVENRDLVNRLLERLHALTLSSVPVSGRISRRCVLFANGAIRPMATVGFPVATSNI